MISKYDSAQLTLHVFKKSVNRTILAERNEQILLICNRSTAVPSGDATDIRNNVSMKNISTITVAEPIAPHSLADRPETPMTSI